tara:strand:- start:1749 stop:2588 length:840 start_codon:yes stop_codon:yes gene_type:complete
MKALEIIKLGSNLLKEKKISSHILDSELLLSKTLNKSREKILTDLNQLVDKKNIEKFREYISRRLKNEPVAYIVKEKEFWSKKFNVSKSTLIPRPETELLVERLIEIFKKKRITILEIGTGSGCILLSLLSNLVDSRGIGLDISNKAISVAKGNSVKMNMSNKVKFFVRSHKLIFEKKFDLIVSNPPYIKTKDIKNLSDDIKMYEPRMALDGGNDGLDLIKKFIYKSKDILKINGMLALEIGNEQFKKVSKILFDNNFRIKHVIKDYENNIRCLTAIYK